MSLLMRNLNMKEQNKGEKILTELFVFKWDFIVYIFLDIWAEFEYCLRWEYKMV